MKSNKREWSPRSQRSWVKQWQLEKGQERLQIAASLCEKHIGELEESVKRLTTATAEGRGGGDYLSDRIRMLGDYRVELDLHKKGIADFQAQIKALRHPSPSQASARRKKQTILAKLTDLRLNEDRKIDYAVKKLNQFLQARSELSAKMRETVAALDLTLSSDGLDERRFDDLLRSLPTELLPESERWADWFLGKDQREANPYVVEPETFTILETLASCHAYRRGDSVLLTEAQARKLAPGWRGAPIAPVEPGAKAQQGKKPEVKVQMLETRRIGETTYTRGMVYTLSAAVAEEVLAVRIPVMSPRCNRVDVPIARRL